MPLVLFTSMFDGSHVPTSTYLWHFIDRYQIREMLRLTALWKYDYYY